MTNERDWKPGDLARIKLRNGVVHDVAIRLPLHVGGWASGGAEFINTVHVMDTQPLVALDLPIGAKGGWDVLVRALRSAKSATGLTSTFDGLIEQIKEQTAPPRLKEPTNRYAIVSDISGYEWIHTGNGVWRNINSPGEYMVEKRWDDTDTPLSEFAVKVLSEGRKYERPATAREMPA